MTCDREATLSSAEKNTLGKPHYPRQSRLRPGTLNDPFGFRQSGLPSFSEARLAVLCIWSAIRFTDISREES